MMKNIKRLIALFIVIILNVNSYAAVGSNDGSAFVTKAEFDAIVNTFNEQMDNYEKNVVSKVDGAIANYLSGLTQESTTTKNVGYLSIIPNNVTSITMQPYDAFPYKGGKPKVAFNGLLVSLYTQVFGSIGRGNFSYTGTTDGRRRFVTQEGTGTNIKYRWNGFTDNYQEQFDITWGRDSRDKDDGYVDWEKKFYCFGIAMFSDVSVTTNPTWTNSYWLIGNVNSTGIGAATSCVVDTKWNSYEITNKYDLMFDDYADADKKEDNLRCFIERNQNNRWFAGSEVSYNTVSSSASMSGYIQMYYGNIDPTSYNVSKYEDTYLADNYKYCNFFSCGYEPITSWGSVLTKDTTIYTDKAKTEGVIDFQNYPMTAGAVFGVVKKDGMYTWPVEFTDTTADTTVWIKYGHFDGEPKASECITVTVDGGVEYSSATIKNGKGTIRFTAPKDGLLFFKWSKGKSLKVDKSLQYVEVNED